MLSYDEVKTLLIQNLERAAENHDAGRYTKISEQFDHVDGALPRIDSAEFLRLYIALSFWDGWIDASNHAWRYYPGIEKKDWPILAKRIVADLRADKDITDQIIVEQFGPRKPEKWSLAKKVVEFVKRYLIRNQRVGVRYRR